ncbi:hypothetical protein FRC04_001870 [Tulasnella sp. 424]|nr:hypothetical protein FRC04_001870 [Tulasnella sp. 424]
MLNPDPAAQTNHLLTLLLRGGMGQSGLTDEQLKPPEFTPPQEAIRLARLLTASLTITLIISAGAMIGKLWMIYYNRGPQGGPSEREARILQRKLAGVYRWGLRVMPELIAPSLFQIALLVFSIGVFGFLVGLDPRVAWMYSIGAWIAVAVFAATNFCAIWDPWCPLKTPLSQFVLFLILLPFDLLPSIILGVTKRFPKTLIRKATRSVMKSLSWDWRQPYQTIKKEKNILGNILDASYIRTISHRFEFNPLRSATAKFRRQDESNDILDAKFACYLLRKTEQSDVLLAVVQSIPTLFDSKAVSILLADSAPLRLHRLFRASIDQAEDDPNAMTQDSDDKTSPIENAVLYGRAIVHLFVALGPHDDWFWDDYETPLSNGWMEQWGLVDENFVSQRILEELKHQRLVIQASLSIGPDSEPPSMEIEPSAMPLYIAASVKSLLHRRVYHHMAHSPPKYSSIVETWTGEDRLERIAFCSAFPRNFPKTIGLVAWALATIPVRRYSREDPILEKYGLFWQDMKGLWDAYQSASSILSNVASALRAYPLGPRSQLLVNKLPSTDIKITYKSMLKATRQYILEGAPRQDVLTNGPPLLDSAGTLSNLMEKERNLTDEDKAVKEAMQSIVDVVVVRRGRRLQQHMRSMSTSGEGRIELEREWFSGDTPAALREYNEWITDHQTSSLDPMEEPRNLFMETWKKQINQYSTIDIGVPDIPDCREEPTAASGLETTNQP